MSPPPASAWRTFPWDPEAVEDAPFSRSWVPQSQGQGRFDLPARPGGVIYLAETPEHAVAERIQHFRGHALDDADLFVSGVRLALVEVHLAEWRGAELADLCSPALLQRLDIRPDETASMSRRVTQGIASLVHSRGYAGLRWWSALRGDWHTLVLFRDRLGAPLAFGEPEPLTLSHSVVQVAMRELGMAAGEAQSRPSGRSR